MFPASGFKVFDLVGGELELILPIWELLSQTFDDLLYRELHHYFSEIAWFALGTPRSQALEILGVNEVAIANSSLYCLPARSELYEPLSQAGGLFQESDNSVEFRVPLTSSLGGFFVYPIQADYLTAERYSSQKHTPHKMLGVITDTTTIGQPENLKLQPGQGVAISVKTPFKTEPNGGDDDILMFRVRFVTTGTYEVGNVPKGLPLMFYPGQGTGCQHEVIAIPNNEMSAALKVYKESRG